MCNKVIILLVLSTVLTLDSGRAVSISPRRDSFNVIKSAGFTLYEQLLAIHEAEQARLLSSTDLKAIAIHMR